MSKFTFVCEDSVDSRKITYEVYSVNLNKVVEEFSSFLKGCGYVFDGELDFVKDDCEIRSDCEIRYPYDEYPYSFAADDVIISHNLSTTSYEKDSRS